MELKPVDSYQIQTSGIISSYDRRIVTLLYQPLMGPDCLALYTTLVAEVEDNRICSQPKSHMQLLGLLNMGIKDFFDARIKLEGLGLLKSYQKITGDERQYLYEVLPPLSPAQFFQDGLLNIYLYSQIGAKSYQRLRESFSDKVIELEHYQEVTRSFQDVFAPYRPNQEVLIEETDEQPISGSEPAPIELDGQDFDLSLVLDLLSPNMLARKEVTADVIKAMRKLHHIYGTTEKEMVRFLYRAARNDGTIDIDQLRKIVRDSHRLANKHYPQLVSKTVTQNEITSDSLSAETSTDPLLAYFEKISPQQRLIDLGEGSASEADLQIIDEVMASQKLPEPVMTVLVDYVLNQLDGKLYKNYMEKIASQWKRKKIQTAKEAMELAVSEHERYKALKEKETTEPKARRGYHKAAKGRKEVLPDWFKNGATQEQTIETKKLDITEEEERALEEQVRKIKQNLKKGR